MLAIQARSFTNYILMQSDNTVEPANFIGNKAVGITFEEKDDHTTYFGTNIEYIEGYVALSSIHTANVPNIEQVNASSKHPHVAASTKLRPHTCGRIRPGGMGHVLLERARRQYRRRVAWHPLRQPGLHRSRHQLGVVQRQQLRPAVPGWRCEPHMVPCAKCFARRSAISGTSGTGWSSSGVGNPGLWVMD